MAEMTDNEIINLVLSGDTDSFEILIERYKDRVFKIVSSHIPAEHTEETANDVFFKAFNSLSKFRNEAPFLHWISIIAVNTCRNYWRSGYSSKEYAMSSFDEDTEKSFQNIPSGKTPEEILNEKEQLKLLEKALSVLNPKERLIINMIYREERSVAEAASLSDMTEANVKVIAFRARKKLADALNKMTGGK